MHDLGRSEPPDQQARHLVVHGRVQGVFFRDSTRRVAVRHDVRGWVRNRPDGTVEAWLEGAPDGVRAVEEWIRAGGPNHARVSSVEAADVTPAGHDSFAVR